MADQRAAPTDSLGVEGAAATLDSWQETRSRRAKPQSGSSKSRQFGLEP